MLPTKKPYVKFEFITEFGDRTVFEKEFDYWDMCQAEALVEQFRSFMLACGFHPDTVKTYLGEA